MDEGFDGDHQASKPLTAMEARAYAAPARQKKHNDANYTLTIKRLYKIIENAAKNGNTELTFKAPSFVLDGAIGDPIVLAKQLKARLVDLGYEVKRKNNTLIISWDFDKPDPK